MGCRFSAGNGDGNKGGKNKVESLGCYRHPGKLSMPSLFPGLPFLHPSQQLFQLFSALFRPPNPPPSFTADVGFTSSPTERTKPPVYWNLAEPVGRPGFQPVLCYVYSCWWAVYLASLRLSFLTCKMGLW